MCNLNDFARVIAGAKYSTTTINPTKRKIGGLPVQITIAVGLMDLVHNAILVRMDLVRHRHHHRMQLACQVR